MQPRQMRETLSPVLPRLTYSIATPSEYWDRPGRGDPWSSVLPLGLSLLPPGTMPPLSIPNRLPLASRCSCRRRKVERSEDVAQTEQMLGIAVSELCKVICAEDLRQTLEKSPAARVGAVGANASAGSQIRSAY